MEIIAAASIISAIAAAGTAVVSGVQANKASQAQADQLDLQQQAEATQASVEEVERQKRLQRVLATQNAIFGGSNVDLATGTPSIIAGDTIAEAARQSRQAGLFSNTRQSILSMQRQDTLSTGRAELVMGGLRASKSLLDLAGTKASLGSVPSSSAVKTDPFAVGQLSGGETYTGGLA